MSKLSLLIIIPSLRGGGAERVVQHLVNNIDRNHFLVRVVTINLNQSTFRNEIKHIEFINLNIKRVRFSIFRIMKIIWKYKPSIVFSTLGYLNIYLACFKALFPKHTKFIARETNIVSKRIALNNYPWVWEQLYVYLRNCFDMVICQSNDMLIDLKTNFRYKNNLVVINNPVDTKFIYKKIEGIKKLESNKIRFVAIGRLSYQKGFDILINAAKQLNISNYEINILGDGELKDKLQEQIEKNNLTEKVFLRGFQDNPYKWILNSDALILSSRFEGFSNVVLESLALETPVIAMPAKGGVIEVLSDVQGCLIAPQMNAESLAATIVQWKNLNQKINKNTINKYSIKKIVEKYEKVFKDLAK